MRISGLTLAGRVLLAPMAGVADPVMRRIAERCGASATVSEMIAAKGLARGDRETRLRLAGERSAAPRVIQIAACDPADAAAAARCAEDAGADWIDVNMGCPCKRVVGGLAGAALMRDEDLAARLLAAALRAVAVPVSVKMRLGWDEASRNAPRLAQRLEAEGAALIAVHGRTRRQFYDGKADWTAIAQVKQAIKIPVIANGDCAGIADARAMLRESGADGVMIGRAALGRPWLVGDVAEALATGRLRRPPDRAARGAIAQEHLDGLMSAMGEEAGLRHARKHLSAYAVHAGLSEAARRALVTAATGAQAQTLIRTHFRDAGGQAAA